MGNFKQKFISKAKAVGLAVAEFCKVNYLMCGYIPVAFLIELTGVAVTAGKFYMTSPWFYISFVMLVSLISLYIPNNKARYAVFMSAILANFIFDMVFIVVFDSTGGTIFDYAMIDLRKDAMIIVETIPFSFAHTFVSALVICLYGTVGFILIKRMPKPDVSQITKVTTSCILVLTMTANVLLAYFTNARYDSNDLNYKLDQQETGTYSNKGIIGNFYNELVRGLFFSEIDYGDENELRNFIYKQTSEPTPMTGKASGFNTVTILCESFEWFTFLYDEQRYPNGYAAFNKIFTPEQIQEKLHRLYPNFYRMYEHNSTIILNNAHSLEKTDISENKVNIGNYPLDKYINYAYPDNALPYSMPNMLETLFGVKSYSFHNGGKDFYNRYDFHTKALGYKDFTSAEDIYPKGEDDGGGLGERNLDSVMFDTCKAQMFPTDRRFNTFITTITQHGQYAYRENLQEYYDAIDREGLLPLDEDDTTSDASALRFYCAAGMDTDKAIGIMLDYLEQNNLADRTLITMFGDHNAYYQGISNYVKNIYSTSAENYTELYRVPVMIKVGNAELAVKNPKVEKFTCVADIYPTIMDLLGVTCFSNLQYGVSAFSEDKSVLYSRAYYKFLTDKIYFNTFNNIIYEREDVDEKYIAEVRERATTLLDKISHINRIFAYNYFDGARGEEYKSLIRAYNEGRDI